MSNKESNIEKTNFDAFIQAVGSEIEQAQVRKELEERLEKRKEEKRAEEKKRSSKDLVSDSDNELRIYSFDQKI